MITGYNTDVRYGEIVLHVQTEDKGQENPFIESLIYYGGQVVVARRESYGDLLRSGKGSEEVTVLMEHQHRMMMKAIRAGEFDDKIRIFAPDKFKAKSTEQVSLETTAGFDISEDSGRTLDQVILEYLTSEAEQEQLVLVMADGVEIKAGSATDLSLWARSSKSGQGIAGAQVRIKMISTFGGPRTLGQGETDGDGFLRARIEVPTVDPGTAALIITASAPVGQAELKHLL